jgi:hypothetical protein
MDRLEGVDILSNRERNGSVAVSKVDERAEEKTKPNKGFNNRFADGSFLCLPHHYPTLPNLN